MKCAALVDVPSVRLNAYVAWLTLLDFDIGYAELADSPGVGHEVPCRMRRREYGRPRSDRKRQKQLISEVQFDSGA